MLIQVVLSVKVNAGCNTRMPSSFPVLEILFKFEYRYSVRLSSHHLLSCRNASPLSFSFVLRIENIAGDHNQRVRR